MPGVLVVHWWRCALVPFRTWSNSLFTLVFFFLFSSLFFFKLLIEKKPCLCSWAGLSAEEIYRAVVKAKKQPPQYASVVGGGIPRELWKMIGECLQFKPSKRPTFNAMLAIFLRHLQEIPRSPPASPDK